MPRTLFFANSGRLLPALFVLLTGCASIPETVRELPADAIPIELQHTPFYSQERYQCGPAALTTVLVSSGANVSLNDIVGKVYLPGREGSLQVEMLAATRTSARLPYVIDPRLGAIHDELAAGRPVVVLQNLGVAAIPAWHYAVVIGIDNERNRVVLRSGTERRLEANITTFLRTWQRSDYWGMVVIDPGDMPMNVDRPRYLGAVAALESAGQLAAAESAWRAALTRWPDDTAALFGLGNVLLASGDFAEAAETFRTILAADPTVVVARNNLAIALLEVGEGDAAALEIERALEDNDDAKLETELLDTQNTIRARLAAEK